MNSTVALDLTDRDGRPVRADMMIRRDTVELYYGSLIVGICDREHLKSWLTNARLEWSYDDVAWARDVDGYSLAIGDLEPNWPITEALLNELRSKL